MNAYEERIRIENEKASEIREKINKAMTILGFTEIKNDERQFGRVHQGYEKGDMKLYGSCSSYGKWRIEISCSYPRDCKGEYIRPYDYNETAKDSITVSSDKSPEQIAKDIERRLMPEYKDRLAKVKEKIRHYDDYHNSTISTLTDLKGFAPDEWEIRNKSFSLRGIKGYGTVKVSGSEASIELSYMSPLIIKKIIALLQKEEEGEN